MDCPRIDANRMVTVYASDGNTTAIQDLTVVLTKEPELNKTNNPLLFIPQDVYVCIFPDQTMMQHETMVLNLSEFCPNTYTFTLPNNDSITSIQNNTLYFTPLSDFIGTWFVQVLVNNTQSVNLSVIVVDVLEKNHTYTETTTQLPAVIGEPVTWIKEVSVEDPISNVNITLEVPSEAKNLVVDGKTERRITTQNAQPREIHITANKTKNLTITYQTPAPEKTEKQSTHKGKLEKNVSIHSEASVHYHNVTSYTEIPETPRALVKFFWLVNQTKTNVIDDPRFNVILIDTNRNGLVDRIEWTVPQLSEQNFVVEIGLATINTKKSIYHPGETAEIIMVVLDSQGHLVENADITVNVTSPSGISSIYNNAIPKSRGVYLLNHTTNQEGIYLMTVLATAPGVDSTMYSYFQVSNNYEFDILRNIPATTDPWQTPLTATIKIVTFTDTQSFTLTETIHNQYEIIHTANATLTELNNQHILTWYNLTNNSIVSYTVRPPYITPALYEHGPASVTYGNETFFESRPWYLAVDPEYLDTDDTEWDLGTYNFTQTDTENVTIQNTSAFPCTPNNFIPDVANHYATIDNGDGTWTTTYQPDGTYGKDSWYTNSWGSNDNQGVCNYVRLGTAGSAGNLRRGVYYFNTTVLPTTSITTANFKTYVYSVSAGNIDVDIHRVTQWWLEGTGVCGKSDDTSGVLWGSYDGTNAWTAGGAFDATVYDSVVPAVTTWSIFDAQSLVQEWVDGTYTNYGILTKPTHEGEANIQSYSYTSDYATAAERPILNITYNPSCYYNQGNYTSKVFDPGSIVTWDNITYGDVTTSNNKVGFYSRSCEDSCSAETWAGPDFTSPWKFSNNQSQYFQYMAFLNTTDVCFRDPLSSMGQHLLQFGFG